MTSALLVDIGAYSRTTLQSLANYCTDITVAATQRIAAALPAAMQVKVVPPLTSWNAAFSSAPPLLIGGSAFDLPETIKEVRQLAAEHDWFGAVFLLGAHAAGSIVAPLNEQAASWSSLVGGIVSAQSGQTTQVSAVEDISAEFSGSVLLTRARRRRPANQSDVSSGQLSAAATVQALLTDLGLQLSNRTGMVAHLRCHLGTDGSSADVKTIDIQLPANESRLLPAAELGAVGEVEGPEGVLRHWSHSSEVVSQGGQRRINRLEIRFEDADGNSIGTGSFGGRPTLSISVNARELSAVLDSPFADISTRFTSAEFQEAPSLLSVIGALSSFPSKSL